MIALDSRAAEEVSAERTTPGRRAAVLAIAIAACAAIVSMHQLTPFEPDDTAIIAARERHREREPVPNDFHLGIVGEKVAETLEPALGKHRDSGDQRGDQREGQDDVADIDCLLKDIPGKTRVDRLHQTPPESVIRAWKKKG